MWPWRSRGDEQPTDSASRPSSARRPSSRSLSGRSPTSGVEPRREARGHEPRGGLPARPARLKEHGVHRVLRVRTERVAGMFGAVRLAVEPRNALGTMASCSPRTSGYGIALRLGLVPRRRPLRIDDGLLLNGLSYFVIGSGL